MNKGQATEYRMPVLLQALSVVGNANRHFMRIQHRYITFDKNEDLTSLLDRLTVKYKVIEKQLSEDVEVYALEFSLYEDNPRFKLLKDAVERFGLTPQIASIFEKDDIEKSDWFIIGTGQYQYPQPEAGYLNATFDLRNYCPHCGSGKIQNAPFRLKTEPKQHNNQFWGLHWEFEHVFVRQETKNILERDIKGIRFSNPVLHKRNIPIDGFYQLHIDAILEKGFDGYNTKVITCKTNNEEGLNTDSRQVYCGQTKYHHPMIGGYLFDKVIFQQEGDIALTSEYFGSGGSANRLVIVSKRFKQIVEKNKLKGLSFTPIIHERFR